jgi:hypothetical protein
MIEQNNLLFKDINDSLKTYFLRNQLILIQN